MLLLMLACALYEMLGFAASASMLRDAIDQPSLVLRLVTDHNTVDDGQFFVTASLTNEGDKPLRVVKEPGGILDEPDVPFELYPASTPYPSDVSDEANKSTGKRAAQGIGSINSSLVPVLRTGETMAMTHDISGLYSHHAPGVYKVRMTPHAIYILIVKEDNKFDYAKARYDHGHDGTMAIIDTRALGNPSPLGRRAKSNNLQLAGAESQMLFRDCNPERQKIILNAANRACSYINEVNAYLSNDTSIYSNRYQTWFGPPVVANWERVKSGFASLTHLPLEIEYDCTCTRALTGARVEPREFGVVQLCPSFWSTFPRLGLSQARAIVHVITHFDKTLRTLDVAYGPRRSRRLAWRGPYLAIRNADNWSLFAENYWWQRYAPY